MQKENETMNTVTLAVDCQMYLRTVVDSLWIVTVPTSKNWPQEKSIDQNSSDEVG